MIYESTTETVATKTILLRSNYKHIYYSTYNVGEKASTSIKLNKTIEYDKLFLRISKI